MKVLFGVQSEGNGHMTQALCVQEYLKTRNYEIGPAFVAKKNKGLAKYFTDAFDTLNMKVLILYLARMVKSLSGRLS